MKKLENPQQAIYDFIYNYYKENGYPPSVREIGQAVGLRSPSTVHTHLKNMEQKGMLVRDSLKQRALMLTEQANTIACASSDTSHAIPLIGSVAAGQPILAVENIEESFPLPSLLLHGSEEGETFMLTVQGDSMLNAGIHNGDILVVNQSLQCEDGDIVVARTQEEAVTVKRIYREKEFVRLQPENDYYSPILLPYEEVEIVGKVIGLMRRF